MGTTTRGDTRAARRAATMRRILDAAWALSRAEGLAGWTLRDLGQAVGMRAPSLYVYVDSKAALYDELYADGYRAFGEVIDALPRDGDPVEVLRRGARAYVAFCVADAPRCQLLFLRTIPGFEPSAGSYALARHALDALGEVLATAGLRDPKELDLWTAVLTGLATQQTSNDPGGDRWSRLVDTAVDRFVARG